MSDYWPWWAGALGLGALTAGSWLVLRRSLGVSGSWSRVVAPRAAPEEEMDAAAFEAALLAATQEAFGDAAAAAPATPAPEPVAATSTKTPRGADAAFLAMMCVGAFLAALASGRFSLSLDMGPQFTRFFGDGWTMVATLAVGGLLVGFGTAMAAGCTSGHGLTGCGSLQKGSLVGTIAFFGSAVGLSFLLGALR